MHIHVMAHVGAAGARAFVGQLYFPMGVVDAVRARPPYAANAAPLVRNADDGVFARTAGAPGWRDGVVQVRALGGGALLAWISIGIDPPAAAAGPTVSTARAPASAVVLADVGEEGRGHGAQRRARVGCGRARGGAGGGAGLGLMATGRVTGCGFQDRQFNKNFV